MTFPPEDIVSALLGDAGGGGGEGYLKLKKFRLTLDPAFRDTKNLRWDTVVSLMEAYAHMDRIYLANIHVLDPVVTGDHDQHQDHQTATTEEFKDAITDSGVKSVLSRCHRLESLGLLEVDGLTLAIMTDDSDVNNNNDTDLGSTLLMTSQEERQKWACYRTLKQLDIRGLGIRRAGYDFLGSDSPQNRAAFRRIRQRVRMLPALERLAVSVWGADEDLLQGFMGIEEEDQRHQFRQLTMEGENGEGEVLNENADQTEAEATATVPTPTTDGAASGGAGSPHHHQNQHNNQEARTLVGPCLRLLKVRGQQGKTFIGSDLERFIRNYPGLRELYTSTIVLDKEAVERLWEAGIEGQSTKRLNIPQAEDN
ncbi:hypothetical protein BGZ89_012069 [Linnemannia elongata]|nr:hypothetical protein BGZ89_012069 [Linnemannia elongata]